MTSGTTRADPVRTKFILLIVLAAVNFSMSLDKQALSVVGPVVQEQFGLTLVELSLVISAMSWSYGIAQIPAGWLIDRYGARRMLVSATALWGIVTLLTPSASGFLSLIVLRLLLGIGQAPDWVASVSVVARRIPDAKRSTATSIILSSLYLGLVVGGPLSLWLLDRYGWESSFYVYGWAGIILAVACLFTPGLDRDDNGQPADASTLSERPPYRRLFASRQFWAIGFSYYAMVTVFGLFWGMLPIYLKSGRGLDLQAMSWMISLPYLFLWGGVLLSGPLSDHLLRRTRSKWRARVPLGAGGMAAACLGLVGVASLETNLAVACSLSLALFGVGFVSNTTWSAVQDIGSEFAAFLSGWVSFCGHLASSTALIAVSIVVERTGSWETAFILPICIAGLGALSWAFIHPQRSLSEN